MMKLANGGGTATFREPREAPVRRRAWWPGA
jgi:hypothetical protein